jgi:fructoselysine 6-phosphate deglycase
MEYGADMLIDANRTLESLEPARQRLGAAFDLGKRLAQDVEEVLFVGCGSPNRALMVPEMWLGEHAPHLQVRRAFPAELVAALPSLPPRKRVAVLASKSGRTSETLTAAAALRAAGVVTVAVTEQTSALSAACDHALFFDQTDDSHPAIFMTAHAFAAGFAGLPGSLAIIDQLPAVLSETMQLCSARAKEDAERLFGAPVVFHIGAGAAYGTAYVFGVCVMLEMLHMTSWPVEAAEFLHGPFEIFTPETPAIVLLTEDETRPIAERAAAFCKTHGKALIYDTRDYPMTGMPVEGRALVGPFVLEVAILGIARELSRLMSHPLSTRRYMGKVSY